MNREGGMVVPMAPASRSRDTMMDAFPDVPLVATGGCAQRKSDATSVEAAVHCEFDPLSSTQLELSRCRAVALQQELLVAYRSPAFRRKLKTLPQDEDKHFRGFRRLVRGVQMEVLPKYGFEASEEGLRLMRDAFKWFVDDPVVSYLTATIAKTLASSMQRRCVEGKLLLHLGPQPKLRILRTAAQPEPPTARNGPSQGERNFFEKAVEEGAVQAWGLPEPYHEEEEEASEASVESEEVQDLTKVPELTKARADALLRELVVAFTNRRFQKNVQLLGDGARPPVDLHSANWQSLDALLAPGVAELALARCEDLLPSYGFAGTAMGLRQVWRAIRPHVEADPLTLEKAAAVLRKLQPHPQQESKEKGERNVQPDLEPTRAKALQRAIVLHWKIIDGLNAPRFQSALNDIHRTFSPSSAEFGRRLRELLQSVYEQVLPRYGYSVDEDGLVDYAMAMGELLAEPDLQVLAISIDSTLSGAWVVEDTYEASAGQRLSRGGVVRLLREHLVAFSDKSFQKRVWALREAMRTGPEDDFLHLAGRKDLAMTLQRTILPKYCLKPDHRGAYSMFLQCARFIFDPEVARLITAINRLLGMEPAAAKAFVQRLQALQEEAVPACKSRRQRV
uniref:Protein C10 n=1 Tax=Alexandrium monilatum TaxID=311494 RepID=A0A7S4UCG8_9DINO